MVDVSVPQRLNKFQRKLLEDLAYSFDNHGNAPPSATKSKAGARRKQGNSPKSEPEADSEPTPEPAATDAEEPTGDDRQKGLFDRIKDTFAPNDD